MTIEDQIATLDDRFRGLWKSRLVDDPTDGNNPNCETGWSVTFIVGGDYGETSYYDSPQKALSRAIEIVKEYKTRGLDRQ